MKWSVAVFLCVSMIVFGVAQAKTGDEVQYSEEREGQYSEETSYKNLVERWLSAAQSGNSNAQTNLGAMYEFGLGVPQDYAEAAKWYRLAAEKGDRIAQFHLGTMYRFGRGVPQDHSEAIKWYCLAAQQGDVFALYHLGELFEAGEGGLHDDILAYAIFHFAAKQWTGDDEARRRRDEIASNLSHQEVLAARALARELGKPKNFVKALNRHLKKRSRR